MGYVRSQEKYVIIYLSHILALAFFELPGVVVSVAAKSTSTMEDMFADWQFDDLIGFAV